MTLGFDLPFVPACGDFANATLVGSASATAKKTIAFFMRLVSLPRPLVLANESSRQDVSFAPAERKRRVKRWPDSSLHIWVTARGRAFVSFTSSSHESLLCRPYAAKGEQAPTAEAEWRQLDAGGGPLLALRRLAPALAL